jgi:hypothetical protein
MRELAHRAAETHGDAEESWRKVDAVQRELAAGQERFATRLEARVAALEDALDGRLDAALDRRLAAPMADLREALRHVAEEETAQRRRLHALRRSPEYEPAFTEPEPLVTYVVPTYDRWERLRDVSLPSILAQTHERIEVIVSGDGAPPETAAVVAECGDPRVRFINRTVRGPYPEDPARRWYTIGSPPYDDGVAAARGRWIATLGDDDAVLPGHAETLLAAAREKRAEHVYGRYRVHYPKGETLEIGGFPPVKGEFILQASLYHAGLSFFAGQPFDGLFEEPNDWSLCRRMLVAGVRFGIVDTVVADKHESRYESHGDWSTSGVPSVD